MSNLIFYQTLGCRFPVRIASSVQQHVSVCENQNQNMLLNFLMMLLEWGAKTEVEQK